MNEELIKEEIDNCIRELNEAHKEFDQALDPDIIDSYIYKIKSLECKYRSLLKKFKSLVS